MIRIRTGALVTLILAVAGMASAQEFRVGSVIVVQPWARATVIKVGAAYLTLRNTGAVADRLIAARSPVAGRVEIHGHLMTDGVARMRKVDGVAVAPGATQTLAPGGLHIMLMGLKKPLKAGETLPLTLVFEKAGSVTVRATVERAGARKPSMQHRHKN